MIFSHKMYIRMYDTDTAQIIFFGSQFRFINDTLEEALRKEGLDLHHLFRESDYCFVVVHAESDYLAPLVAGDEIEVKMTVFKIGVCSFGFDFEIYKTDTQVLSGKARTVHVVVDPKTRQKKPIPDALRKGLEKYQV